MTTYFWLNALFLLAVILALFLLRRRVRLKPLAVALGVVVALTAVFDPLIIAAGLVDYDKTKLLGLYWLNAPVEDFAYALFAVPFVAVLWHLLERRHD